MTKEEIIEAYSLQPHPEGGWFTEVYRAQELVTRTSNATEPLRRNAATLIYYLLDGTTRAAWHRLSCDEIWIHLEGDAVELLRIEEKNMSSQRVGRSGDDQHSALIVGNTWFRARCNDEDSWALCMCFVAPGFDFADFEMASEERLKQEFPEAFATTTEPF